MSSSSARLRWLLEARAIEFVLLVNNPMSVDESEIMSKVGRTLLGSELPIVLQLGHGQFWRPIPVYSR